MRPKEEITAEIEALTTMKPTVLHHSKFGDDHHAAIDAQVQVLEDGLSEDDVYDEFPEGDFADNIRDSALDAARWAEGDSDDVPSEQWKDLVRS